jgi:hypothetical protein
LRRQEIKGAIRGFHRELVDRLPKRENDPKAVPSRNLMSIAGLESELIEYLSDCLPDVSPLICSIEILPTADLGIWETQPSNTLPHGLG